MYPLALKHASTWLLREPLEILGVSNAELNAMDYNERLPCVYLRHARHMYLCAAVLRPDTLCDTLCVDIHRRTALPSCAY